MDAHPITAATCARRQPASARDRAVAAYAVGRVQARFCDEFEHGFGWIADELFQRCSHALVVGGRVWLLDPVDADGVEERVRAAGAPAGVIQLIDRHGRDCRVLAERLGVPHHGVPRRPLGDAPFKFLSVARTRVWQEVALWWPEARVLACGDALATHPALLAARERVALHPLLRPFPPRATFGGLDPLHIVCGHGEGVHGDEATAALRTALANARRGLPSAWLRSLRTVVRRAV
jgi:hypothetical protein